MPDIPNPQDPSFSDFIAAEVKKAADAQAAAAAGQAPPVTAPPVELNIAGQKYTFTNHAELEQALNQFVNTTAGQMATLQQQAQAPVTATPQAAGAYVPGTDAPAWSDEAFIEKMTKSPREGMAYAFNHILFDGKADDPIAEAKGLVQKQEQVNRVIAANQFRNMHPEFPGGPQAAEIIDRVRQGMNLPYDINGLEAAYFMAQNKGFLPDYRAQAQQAAWQAQQAAAMQAGQAPAANPAHNPYLPQTGNPYLNAPPTVNRSAPSSYDPAYDPENLSLDALETVLKNAGALNR